MAQIELDKFIKANDEKIQKIAESARAITLESPMSADELFDYMIAGMEFEAKFMRWAFQNIVSWPRMRDEAYKNYADALGKQPLTEDEKKQAWMNYVLEESE